LVMWMTPTQTVARKRSLAKSGERSGVLFSCEKSLFYQVRIKATSAG
jgi:hypothetical protein